MVCIIGVDHLIQYRNGIVPDNIFKEFRKYLKEQTGIYHSEVLAEEFNREFLQDLYYSSEATVESAASEMNLQHIFCDPDEEERKILNIPYYADIMDNVMSEYRADQSYIHDIKLRNKINAGVRDAVKSYWSVREEFWFQKISGAIDKNILFICGYEHAARFEKLLQVKGLSVMVINPFWKKELFSDYKNFGI